MDTCRNIFPITFEPVRKLLITAYKSGDFTAADAIIARNTVKQTAMVWKLMNGSMDAYCWSSGRAVAYMLSRTSHPGYTLQLTDFYQGRAIGDIDIKHAGELALPDGACAVGVVHADSTSPAMPLSSLGISTEETTPAIPSSRIHGLRTLKYRFASVRRRYGNPSSAVFPGEGKRGLGSP